MAHSLSGQGKKFAAWAKQLSSKVKSRLKENKEYYSREVFRSFPKKCMIDSNEKSNVPKLLAKLLSDDETSGYLMSLVSKINVFVENQFVSIDEFAQAIDAVPDTCLRKPDYLIERAGMLMKRKTDIVSADKDYDRARELATSLSLAPVIARANAHQARMYFDNGKKGEAEKLAATVDVCKLSDQDTKQFAPLVKFAKPTPPANPPTTKETP
jgi:hypothetical protein